MRVVVSRGADIPRAVNDVPQPTAPIRDRAWSARLTSAGVRVHRLSHSTAVLHFARLLMMPCIECQYATAYNGSRRPESSQSTTERILLAGSLVRCVLSPSTNFWGGNGWCLKVSKDVFGTSSLKDVSARRVMITHACAGHFGIASG